MKIHVKCNGKQQEWDVTPNEYLADTLRSQMPSWDIMRKKTAKAKR